MPEVVFLEHRYSYCCTLIYHKYINASYGRTKEQSVHKVKLDRPPVKFTYFLFHCFLFYCCHIAVSFGKSDLIRTVINWNSLEQMQ